jgi:hypothetical protein
MDRARRHIVAAKNLLKPLEPSVFKESLLFLADYVLERDR